MGEAGQSEDSRACRTLDHVIAGRTMKHRRSGILLHIISLPSPYGIGDLGPSAYRFADFLAEARQSFWQVLPLNPTRTTHGNSPYDSYSAFAGNPLMISPDLLLETGLLSREELGEIPPFPDERVDYQAVTEYKAGLLQRAFESNRDHLSSDCELERFCRENDGWLEDYALFSALKAQFKGAVWSEWPLDVRDRQEAAIEGWKTKLRERILKEQFIQYLFFKQWAGLKRYCNDKHISIVGDLPIYVNYDSADVWVNPQIFKLGDDKRPTVVAGVPPDYFSATGQLWGNPVYDWEKLKLTRYDWWVRRLKHNLACFGKIRLDHFRGFVACWEVPAGEATAIQGEWVEAPGGDFFEIMLQEFPALPVLAEDLGMITPDVRQVMDRFGFPGMRVLLFAFGPELPTGPHAPHNYGRNCVVYTGTHDNNTVVGWYKAEAQPDDRERLFSYLGRKVSEEEVHWGLIRLALASVAETTIIPMQDLLGLGEEGRMNHPATKKGNWEWRLGPEQLTPFLTTKLAQMTELYGRALAPAIDAAG